MKTILKTTALLTVMLFCFFRGTGQVADTLKEVKVRAKRKVRVANDERLNTYSPGQTVVTIDSITLQQYKFQNMANLLSQQVPVFVKSYGLNNIATLNFRGASAAQSQVYWNGVPIQNAALGIADVSLLPVSLMNKVSVVYGSSSALWGSGNVGGALLVENDLPEYTDTGSVFRQSVSGVAASFGHYQAGIKSTLATRRLVLSLDAFGQSARNNFWYEDNDGKEARMNNVQLQSGVGLLQAGYKINERQTITARAWYQQYYREIPRALFEAFSVKNQRDESLRTLVEWKRKGATTNTYVKASYIRDIVWYEDSSVNILSKNFTNQVYAEAGIDHRFNEHHKLLLFTPVHLSWIDRMVQGDRYEQKRYALAAAYLYSAFNDRLNISLNGRGEVIDDLQVLLPGINAAFDVTYWLQLRANVQKTFRMPTLNELYYDPGGNASLKPEKGWNQDLGYTINLKNNVAIQHSLGVYNRVIEDWIIWLGGAIWTPHNIARVHSRGLQTENKFSQKVGNVTLHLGVNASYTLATTMESYLPGDGSIGKQIPYTPYYNGQGNAGLTWERLYVNYNHTYTGLRYITVDESYYLPYYTQGNLQMMYAFTLGANTLQLTAQCNNIWDARFQVVNARPMPGVNWLVGASFDFGG